MTEHLYPKPGRRDGWTERRRWRVDYSLRLGGSYRYQEWSSYHYWRWTARFAAWSAYGNATAGSVSLTDQYKEKQA